MRPVRVVAVGGGTGMPILLRGLLKIVPEVDAIVTVADDGGSSGRLRQELAVPPPGDSRNCLVAMGDDAIMSRLFQYRFPRGEGLKSHALGNLIIAALTEMTGDFSDALAAAGNLVGARGRVLPPSLEPLTLYADVEPWPAPGRPKRNNAAQSPRSNSGSPQSGPGFVGQKVDERRGGGAYVQLRDRAEAEDNAADGVFGRVIGQCSVANRLRPLKSIGIDPANAPANPAAVAAIGDADLIIMGPGSLFTSVLANLLVKDIGKAVRRATAKKVFLCNITVQPGETDGFTAADHVEALLRFGGPGICDAVVTSNSVVGRARLDELAAAGSAPLVVDDGQIKDLGVDYLAADLTDDAYPTHHSADKIAAALRGILARHGFFESS